MTGTQSRIHSEGWGPGNSDCRTRLVLVAVASCLFVIAPSLWQTSALRPALFAAGTPDIILMMADDLGFSDIGCYGGEIPTPHLDKLAEDSLVFTNFSNTSRCCPSRASLLTGRYSHRVGVGEMNHAGKGPSYQGQLQADAPTIAENLKREGYATAMVGKWHLTRADEINDGPNGSWPLERGFDRFYGSMEGAKNYFRPTWLFDDKHEVKSFDENFFYTEAISRRAARWIEEQPDDQPLFLYAAFYAPHFPLQAPWQVIAKHRGNYLAGWDVLRERRFAKQKRLGVIPAATKLSARPDDVPAWSSVPQSKRDQLDQRMATYAAQVELLDRGVGRVVTALRDAGRLDNALLIFLSDNGAASSGGVFGAGPADTIGSIDAPVKTTYGKGWATLSNTPFRMHKANTHEGGVMSPLIVRPPPGISPQAGMRHDVAHIIDVAPTCLGAAGVDRKSHGPKPDFDGINLLQRIRQDHEPVFYEHQGSRAVRQGRWKLVNPGKTTDWELYDLSLDRTEQDNLAKTHGDQMRDLVLRWQEWAKRWGVRFR